MLSYVEFKTEFLGRLSEELKGSNTELRENRIQKVNGTKDGISIIFPGINPVAPTFYCEDFYREYTRAGRDITDMVKDVAGRVQEERFQQIDIPDISRDEAVRQLYAGVINKEKNTGLLEVTPHIDVNDDLAVVARYRIGENGSILVNHDFCSFIHMTGEEALEQARVNTREGGYLLQPLHEMIRGIMMDAGAPEEYTAEIVPLDAPQIYVLTNASGYDGAVLGTDPAIIGEIRGRIGEDFSILPSSRHELLLVPDSLEMDHRELEQMVCDVNRQVVDAQDFLSDHVYHVGPSLSLEIQGQDRELIPGFDMEKIPGRSR